MWQWIIHTLPNKKQWNLNSTHAILFIMHICLILFVFGLPKVHFIFSILNGMKLLIHVGMWQIKLINFPIHPFSQPANFYWALGVGNMQGSWASKMKVRCFLLLYRGKMPFSVFMFGSGVPQTWFIIIAWVGDCWVSFMILF